MSRNLTARAVASLFLKEVELVVRQGEVVALAPSLIGVLPEVFGHEPGQATAGLGGS